MKTILLMAMTLDGKTAKNSMHPVDWTGKQDKKYFVKITRDAGAVIMGSRTYDTIGKPLPGRKNIIMTKNKTRKSQEENLVFTDKNPEEILKELKKQGYEKAAVIGGSIINSLFAERNLIDEIHVMIVPRLFGKGLSIFNKDMDISLELLEAEKMGRNHLLIKYLLRD